jgi:hypothetical protein
MDSAASAAKREWRVVIRSVGTAAAHIEGTLRQALPFSEERLAACIYQAPAELLGPLDRATAEHLTQALVAAGLEAEILGADEPFTPGGPDYDVALAVQRTDSLVEVVRETAAFLGVAFDQAKQILCTCPAELIGKVSQSTVESIRRRFEPLGVAVDASRRDDALYDVFLSPCPAAQRAQVRRELQAAGFALDGGDEESDGDHVLIGTGLRKNVVEALLQRVMGSGSPLKIVNRDFQRFDVRLDEASDTPGMIEFLVLSSGMPETVARKVPARTPIFTHHNLRYQETRQVLNRIARLGGRASAHLLALQRFRLQLAKIGDTGSTTRLLEVLGGVDPEWAREMVRSMGTLDRPATAPQARWLQYELRRVGTDSRMLMA